jgi:hypothetical protein
MTEKTSNKEFFERSSELRVEDFIANVKNENISDETVEAMFWEIYAQGDEAKIKNALEALEKSETRKKITVDIAEAIIADKEKAA